MIRPTSLDEIEARTKSGDRSFLRWLQSSKRRESLIGYEALGSSRLLSGYWRSVTPASGTLSVLVVGCGLGESLLGLLQSEHENVSFLGLDCDVECIKSCQSRFGRLPGVQFRAVDSLYNFELHRKFHFVVVSSILESLPGYTRLVGDLWCKCQQGLLITFSETLKQQAADQLGIDVSESRLYARYSESAFCDFCSKLTSDFHRVNVYSDNGLECEHLCLLRRSETVPTFDGVHQFSSRDVTFPFYEIIQ